MYSHSNLNKTIFDAINNILINILESNSNNESIC